MPPETHCASCGAALPPLALTCPYCDAPTPLHHQQAADAQREAASEAHEQRLTARKSASSSARHALVWGLLSIPCTCFAVPAIVAIIAGARAARLARSVGDPTPGRAIAAIVIGSLSMIFMVAGWTFSVVTSRHVAARRADVAARVDRGAPAATLSTETACALVEQRLLDVETEGISPTGLEEVRCNGAFTQTAEKATLEDVRFSSGSRSATVTACFTHGARWALADLIKGGTCEHPSELVGGDAGPG